MARFRLTNPLVTADSSVQQNFEGIQSYLNERGPAVFAGAVMPTAGATAPTGWLLCDGAAVSRTTYSALFAAISTYYGAGDGSTTFNVPNIKGKVPVGIDTGQAEFDTRGETGGAKTHTLTASESGVNGNGTTNTAGSHQHQSVLDAIGNILGEGGAGGVGSYNVAAGVDWLYPRRGANITGSAGSHQHSLNARSADSAHNNLQPYIALHYVICTG